MSILITGGSGFFGRSFTRFLLDETRELRICIYSRSEHAQAEMRAGLSSAEQARIRFFIGDVRDLPRLRRAMHGCKFVVHAAALKRIEVGASNPSEVVKTNVLGAMNVIEAAAEAGVKRVVALSTDKAYQPVSPYGQSKALAESLFLAANTEYAGGPEYFAVRYGNVWGSRGSVVPTWKAMIDRGAATLPVTDPDCTRFFMTIEAAVRLVWKTLYTLDAPSLVYPRNLPAYRLGDLAEAFGLPIHVTGLPAHEKLHESMSDDFASNFARRMTVTELRKWIAK